MRKRRSSGTSPWVVVAALGAVAGVVAIGVHIASAKDAAPPKPLTPLPLGPPVPTPDLLAMVMTDPGAVRASQSIVADGISDPHDAQKIGMHSDDYTAADVDGNPSNPRFVRVLAAFQSYFNGMLEQIRSGAIKGTIPTWFPHQLRTDGVLDYATSVALDKA